MAGYLLDVKFIDGNGRRSGGLTAECSEEEARSLAAQVLGGWKASALTAPTFTITAPWVEISLRKLEETKA